MARELTTCTLCPAAIWWALSTNDHRIAFDEDAHPGGTYVPVVTPDGNKRMQPLTGAHLPAQQPAWRRHDTTCPASEEGRRRAARDRQRCGDCRGPMDPWLPTNGHRWHIGCGPAWPGEIRANLRRDAA
jgi:hypothetical protein